MCDSVRQQMMCVIYGFISVFLSVLSESAVFGLHYII